MYTKDAIRLVFHFIEQNPLQTIPQIHLGLTVRLPIAQIYGCIKLLSQYNYINVSCNQNVKQYSVLVNVLTNRNIEIMLTNLRDI